VHQVPVELEDRLAGEARLGGAVDDHGLGDGRQRSQAALVDLDGLRPRADGEVNLVGGELAEHEDVGRVVGVYDGLAERAHAPVASVRNEEGGRHLAGFQRLAARAEGGGGTGRRVSAGEQGSYHSNASQRAKGEMGTGPSRLPWSASRGGPPGNPRRLRG